MHKYDCQWLHVEICAWLNVWNNKEIDQRHQYKIADKIEYLPVSILRDQDYFNVLVTHYMYLL